MAQGLFAASLAVTVTSRSTSLLTSPSYWGGA